MKPILEVQNLKLSLFSFSKKVRVIRGATFHVDPKEVIGLVGESGCGKSMIARTLMGLVSPIYSKIEAGRILYRNEDLLLKTRKEACKIYGKEMAIIFQDSMTSLNPTMKIGDQIVEGHALHYPEVSAKKRKERALDLLKKVGIGDPVSRFKQYPHTLSGGMRQRVMIASALMCFPSLLIADEPTTALDVTIQAQILNVLKDIQEATQMSTLLITHDLSLVAQFCHRVLVMYAGEIIESASVKALFDSPLHPYTQLLLNAIPRLDLPTNKKITPIPGAPPDLSLKIQGCPFAPRCPHAMPLCFSQKPPNHTAAENHSVNCWLFHPEAEKKEDPIEFPFSRN